MSKKMKCLIFTADIEELVANEFGADIPKEVLFEISRKGLQLLMEMLERRKARATFFVTLEFAEFCPEGVKKAIGRGHEIGLHAYSHTHRYGKMNEEEAFGFLREAKEKLEKKFGVNIVSFRGPQMSRPSYHVLEEIGIKYDSSYHPTYVPGKYNNLFRTRKVHSVGSIKVLPVSVAPIFRLPFSWIWFRNMPLWYSKACAWLTLLRGDYVNIYFHPWEFVNVMGFEGKIPLLVIRKTGNKLISKLEGFIGWLIGKGLKPVTVREYFERGEGD